MTTSNKIPIFIDTNVLLHHFDYKIDIEEAINRIISKKYQIFVHRLVEEEILDALTQKGKQGRNARIAVQLISRYQSYETDIAYDGTDIAIMESAQKENGCVFTFDKALKHRCKAQMIPVISNYKKGRLELSGTLE